VCIVYALVSWWRHGGKVLIVFHRGVHVVNISGGMLRHGTKKGTGKWHLEERPMEGFFKYLGRM
jgi:hypothetical protein